MSAKELLNVTHTIGPITSKPPQARIPRLRDKGYDHSIEGVLVFSGIGLLLMVLAVMFHWLELPPPYF